MLPVLLFSLASFLPADTCTDLFVPNALHNENDFILRIRTTCEFKEFKLLIFDRWGTKKFETNDPAFELNMLEARKEKDKVAFTPGVYLYLIEATLKDKEKPGTYTGTITFIH